MEEEKKRELEAAKTEREAERVKTAQAHREKLAHVENNFEREQHSLRSFVFQTAHGMISYVNRDKALRSVDSYQDSDDDDDDDEGLRSSKTAAVKLGSSAVRVNGAASNQH